MMPESPRDNAIDIFRSALGAVDPYECVKRHMPRVVSEIGAGKLERVLLVSFGKASSLMAKAASDHLPAGVPVRGIALTKYGHAEGVSLPAHIETYEAGHPIPDEAGLLAAQKILELLSGTDERTLALFLLSGGGSALLVSPQEGMSLADKQGVTGLLLKAGASIDELNTVRKHLSRVKGGRLAQAAYPARGMSLILSDVIGDRLDVIASGPTSADPSTFGDAISVLEKYGLSEAVPARAMDVLRRGLEGAVPETPKPGGGLFDNFENIIVGSNKLAAETAKRRAEELGYSAVVMSTKVEGEARDVAGWFASRAKEMKGALAAKKMGEMCLIFGGETTVTVKGSGLGGRNTELALAFAMAVEGTDGVTLLSGGTDGNDGPTDAAGAVVNGSTIKVARSKGLDPQAYLDRNDSYHFFKETDELLITGPTGTNVMDLQIILIKG